MVRRAAIIFLLLTLVSLAYGQKKPKVPLVKSVTGSVVNTDGEPLPGAIVQLKNLKSLEIRSFIAKAKGEYYFHSLSADVDYELKAEWNGKPSNVRLISSFDSHSDLLITLQLK